MPVHPPRAAANPLFRILALLARMRAAFPECALSLSLLTEWAHDLRAWLARKSADVAAIDDEMERVAPELWKSLQNDPPALRRKIWTAWQTTHARTEATAAELKQ